jgi:hypothetical protein
MVDAQPGIAPVGVAEIIPEGVDALARMHAAQGVAPALRQQAMEGRARFRTEQ